MKRITIASLAIAAFATSALAHPGHGHPERAPGILHYVLEPEHAPLSLALLVALLVVGRVVLRLRRRER